VQTILKDLRTIKETQLIDQRSFLYYEHMSAIFQKRNICKQN